MVELLVMDDNPADVALFEIGISDCLPNCSLKIIESREQLLSKLEKDFNTQNLTDKIVILDLFSPNNEGLVILELIRKNDRFKNIPVIILTNTQELSVAETAYGLGADAYLFKPNDYDEFIAMLHGITSFFHRVWLKM